LFNPFVSTGIDREKAEEMLIDHRQQEYEDSDFFKAEQLSSKVSLII